MLVQQLLDDLDQTITYLHVDVNLIRDKLISMGIQDRIIFHFVRMDKDKVRGLLHRYKIRSSVYATPALCSDVIIPKEMGEEAERWKRLVAVKELLHITDCDRLTAASTEAVNNLFSKFAMPPELRSSGSDDLFVSSFLNDRVRIYFALACLVPGQPREALRRLYQAQRLSDQEIAAIAQIPERYVPQVMSEGFDELIGTLIRWELEAQID